jgi:ABC-type uncharacterized transport system ATPase subunit
MTIRPGELSVVTGVPSSGKSEFIDALAVNFARNHGGRFAMCGFEKDPTLAEIQMRKVRFKSVGRIGTVSLRWDRVTGRYAEITANRGAGSYPK